jgi:hypothetical protein
MQRGIGPYIHAITYKCGEVILKFCHHQLSWRNIMTWKLIFAFSQNLFAISVEPYSVECETLGVQFFVANIVVVNTKFVRICTPPLVAKWINSTDGTLTSQKINLENAAGWGWKSLQVHQYPQLRKLGIQTKEILFRVVTLQI